MKTKKQQIEIILNALKKFYSLDDKINKLFGGDLEQYGDVYDIGYKVIPAILGIDINKNEHLDDALGDLFWGYICGVITKKEYFNKIDKYLED
ncbi:MAG: hypothetical protein IKE01_06515 [Clostridia bacterium]|nr:hypothetical protein [Clostridia bacterium]